MGKESAKKILHCCRIAYIFGGGMGSLMFTDFTYIDKNLKIEIAEDGSIRNTFWFTMPVATYQEYYEDNGDSYNVYEYISFPLNNYSLDSFRFFRTKTPYYWNIDLADTEK